MRYPFWIFNSILLGLLILSLGFMFFSQQPIPRIKPIEPQELKIPSKQVSKIELRKIYTNDLFNTYKEPTAAVIPGISTQPPMPQPPAPRPVKIPLPAPIKFLEPLQITLRGVLIVADESENVALVEDNQTKATKNYKPGEKIGDGYVLRIARNRLTILRSNGQQETLYVTADDPDLKKLLITRQDWTSIVQKTGPDSYLINPSEFITYVPTLAQFIDTFNITTVYKEGQSIGCRIGIIEQNTLAQAMGFNHGDIVTAINDIPTKTTGERLAIYQKIINLDPYETVTVSLLRNHEPLTIHYKLQDFNQEQPTKQEPISATRLGGTKTAEEIQQEKERIMRERYKFAPTVRDLRNEQKHDISTYNRRNHRTLLGSLTEP
jgi:type II secretory pathway component PulC